MKVWARMIKDGKNIKDTLYEDNCELCDIKCYEIMLREVAYSLDIPTPLTLQTHLKHFNKFNLQKFKFKDFIESINFDWLEIERYE